MDAPTYAESELILNRAPVLLSGGAVQERAAWAQEAAEIGGKPLVTVTRPEQLGPALLVRNSVLYVPDVLTLGDGGQQLLVRTLTSLDERPKLVLGLNRTESSARQTGVLREDLHYRLRMGLLNLDAPGLREAIANRRVQWARRAASPPPRQAPARVSGPTAIVRPAPARAPAPPPRSKSKSRRTTKARPVRRSRSAPRLKSARTAKSVKRPRSTKRRSKRR
ncbi:MAG TPA: Fis family transcriptional regulator [Myxococcaceae bacterium]|nr:Fis family transcriptional regulator [Myxococcaceae bacterium]